MNATRRRVQNANSITTLRRSILFGSTFSLFFSFYPLSSPSLWFNLLFHNRIINVDHTTVPRNSNSITVTFLFAYSYYFDYFPRRDTVEKLWFFLIISFSSISLNFQHHLSNARLSELPLATRKIVYLLIFLTASDRICHFVRDWAKNDFQSNGRLYHRMNENGTSRRKEMIYFSFQRWNDGQLFNIIALPLCLNEVSIHFG